MRVGFCPITKNSVDKLIFYSYNDFKEDRGARDKSISDVKPMLRRCQKERGPCRRGHLASVFLVTRRTFVLLSLIAECYRNTVIFKTEFSGSRFV